MYFKSFVIPRYFKFCVINLCKPSPKLCTLKFSKIICLILKKYAFIFIKYNYQYSILAKSVIFIEFDEII
jgi:hypothetical protein